MADLKLIALDGEDLTVVSAHLQDAVVKVADLVYLPREKRFASLLNRFDWSDAAAHGAGGHEVEDKAQYARRRTALRFERVLAAQVRNISFGDKKRVLNLLAIQFEADGEHEPSGSISLIFAGDAAIRLKVECIEAEMRDMGGAWATQSKPDHPADPDDADTSSKA